MRQDKVMSLVGIAKRAGKAAGGAFCVEKEIRRGNAFLVVISGDASENTKKKLSGLCKHFKVPHMIYGEGKALGNAMGSEYSVCLAVTDAGLADGIKKCMNDKDGGAALLRR